MGVHLSTTDAYQSVQATVAATPLTLVTFGFTLSEVESAARCIIFVNTNSIRIDWSGNAPSTTVGAILTGVYDLISTENIKNLQIVRDGASSSEVFIILEN